jgi:hypothetical protein
MADIGNELRVNALGKVFLLVVQETRTVKENRIAVGI